MTLRLIQETECGVMVSDGDGWREPYADEFVAIDGGSSYLALNSERTALAWLKGIFVGACIGALAVVAVLQMGGR